MVVEAYAGGCCSRFGFVYSFEKQSRNQLLCFLQKDYTLSPTAIEKESIADASGKLLQTLSYDAWGRRRNANDWADYSVTAGMFDRGFTGHEHLDEFGLINMNGRVYDPYLARFLSPDPFVQAPDYSQNFNRYSYAWNNPLKYTDPSGEIVFTVLAALFAPPLLPMAIGADIGWISGGIRASNKPNMNFWDGAWRGGLVGLLGGALSPIGGAGMTFGANLIFGATQGAITGGVDAMLWGEDIGKGLKWGAFTGALFATLTSENLKNMTKGKGFYNNENVFRNYRNGKYSIPEGSSWQQETLNYFGFEGVYYGEGQSSTFINLESGECGIRFRDDDFTTYSTLRNANTKESFHLNRLKNQGWELADTDIFEAARWPEERLGVIHQYKNQGLYYRDKYNYLNAIRETERNLNLFNEGLYNTPYSFTPFRSKWSHFIYKIPRRW